MPQIDVTEKIFSTRDCLRAFFRFLSPYRRQFILASLARLAGDLVWLYPSYAFATIISFFAHWHTGEPVTLVWYLLGGWGVGALIRHGGQYLARIQGFLALERAALDAQVLGMEQLFALDMSWHEGENSGNKLKRLERGAEAINRIGRIWINNLIEIMVNLIGMVFILATIDRFISASTLFFVIIFYLLSSTLLRRASAAAREVNAKEEDLNGILFEGINNIRSAKVLDMPSAFLKIVKKAADEVLTKIRVRILRFQSRNLVLGLWANAFRLFAFSFIIYEIMQGHADVGFLVLFYGYFVRVNESVLELSDVVQDLVISKYAIGRMMDILDEPIYKEGKEATKPFPENWKTIAVKDVTFSYGGHQVLKNLSFSITRGERIGIVGLSGAGKSTLFKLLLKENENYTGEILFDDLPLKKIKKSSYYQRASVVLQDTEVFNFTLRENITLAQPSKAKNEKALAQALEIAHVSSFLSRLPNGLQTLIGEKGVKLSGGERQRVGIARAIFKEPDLLFLDEATSHLDLESEEKIRDSLHVFFQNVTAVVIAHRLSTIKEMDRILVLEKGGLIEEGNFEELYKRKGRFYELWEKQKLS